MSHLRCHRPRRLQPAEVLQPILELAFEERLARYRDRYRVLEYHAEHHEELSVEAARLTRAAEALGVPTTWGPVDLLARTVARFCRALPSGPCLPAVFTGNYFETPPRSLHWLDLHGSLLRAALLDHERPRRHHHGGAPRLRDAGCATLALLSDLLYELVLADPVGVARSPVFSCVLNELIARAHSEGPTAQWASATLGRLGRALLPDGRTHRPRRRLVSKDRQARRHRLAELTTTVAEAQERFAAYCATVKPEELPPPLRRVNQKCAPLTLTALGSGPTLGK